MENNLTIMVNVVDDGEKAIVSLHYPHNQKQLSPTETAIMLTSAVAMIVKTSAHVDGLRDYELMEMVVNYLNSEFINNDSFKEYQIFKDGYKGINDK